MLYSKVGPSVKKYRSNCKHFQRVMAPPSSTVLQSKNKLDTSKGDVHPLFYAPPNAHMCVSGSLEKSFEIDGSKYCFVRLEVFLKSQIDIQSFYKAEISLAC